MTTAFTAGQVTPRTRPRGTRRRAPRTALGAGGSRRSARRSATAAASVRRDPTTIRSAFRDSASSRIACPIERARTTSVSTSTPWSWPSARASSSVRSTFSATSGGSSPSSGYLRGTRTTVNASDLAPALLRDRDRRRDHLLADVAELHRDEDALELRSRRKLLDRRDVLQEPVAGLAPNRHEDDQAGEEPQRARVARARVRRQREHPDREGRAARRRAAASGSRWPRIVTSGRARNGRRSAGSRIRSQMTASCAAVNASRTPNE